VPVMEDESTKIKLLASTGTEFCCSINEYKSRQEDPKGIHNDIKDSARLGPDGTEGEETNYFKSMQWYNQHLIILYPDQT
jgi:hypothetical protein